MIFDKNLDSSWWALRIGLGLAACLAGLDKFFNLLTNWSMYLSPVAERFLLFTANTFMHIIGPIEMLVGLAVLTSWTRIGAYAAAVWLVAIAVNLVSTGTFYDLAVRDIRDGDRRLRPGEPDGTQGPCAKRARFGRAADAATG
jgi:hypothetical protein